MVIIIIIIIIIPYTNNGNVETPHTLQGECKNPLYLWVDVKTPYAYTINPLYLYKNPLYLQVECQSPVLGCRKQAGCFEQCHRVQVTQSP